MLVLERAGKIGKNVECGASQGFVGDCRFGAVRLNRGLFQYLAIIA